MKISWENVRTFVIALGTYGMLAVYMAGIQTPSPELNAVVPTVGFLLSTLKLTWLKEIWIRLG